MSRVRATKPPVFQESLYRKAKPTLALDPGSDHSTEAATLLYPPCSPAFPVEEKHIPLLRRIIAASYCNGELLPNPHPIFLIHVFPWLLRLALRLVLVYARSDSQATT